jgi:toxin ParE1/3/4
MSTTTPLRFTFQSCADLNDIWDSLATVGRMWSVMDSGHIARAQAFVQVLTEMCRLVRERPHLGMDRSDLHPGLRSVLFQNYLLFYRLRGDHIEVLRILGAARDVDLALFA